MIPLPSPSPPEWPVNVKNSISSQFTTLPLFTHPSSSLQQSGDGYLTDEELELRQTLEEEEEEAEAGGGGGGGANRPQQLQHHQGPMPPGLRALKEGQTGENCRER